MVLPASAHIAHTRTSWSAVMQRSAFGNAMMGEVVRHMSHSQCTPFVKKVSSTEFTTSCIHRISGYWGVAWVVGAGCTWAGGSCGVVALGGVTVCAVEWVGLAHRSRMTLSQTRHAPGAMGWCSGPIGPWLVQKRVPPIDRQSLGVAPEVGVCGSVGGVVWSGLLVVGTGCCVIVGVCSDKTICVAGAVVPGWDASGAVRGGLGAGIALDWARTNASSRKALMVVWLSVVGGAAAHQVAVVSVGGAAGVGRGGWQAGVSSVVGLVDGDACAFGTVCVGGGVSEASGIASAGDGLGGVRHPSDSGPWLAPGAVMG